eukprot:754426-Hanusia_phi.AAC.1
MEIKRGAVSKTGAGNQDGGKVRHVEVVGSGSLSNDEVGDALPSSLIRVHKPLRKTRTRDKNVADFILDHTLGKILDGMDCDRVEKIYAQGIGQ